MSADERASSVIMRPVSDVEVGEFDKLVTSAVDALGGAFSEEDLAKCESEGRLLRNKKFLYIVQQSRADMPADMASATWLLDAGRNNGATNAVRQVYNSLSGVGGVEGDTAERRGAEREAMSTLSGSMRRLLGVRPVGAVTDLNAAGAYYKAEMGRDVAAKGVSDFLLEERAYPEEKDEDTWRAAIRRALDENFLVEAPDVPFTTWVANPGFWGTSGSGAGAKVKLRSDKRKETLRSKWAYALSTSTAERVQSVKRAEGQALPLHVFYKLDDVKPRLIISDAMEPYLVASYVGSALRASARRDCRLSMFWSARRMASERADWQAAMNQPAIYCPIDISKFDNWMSSKLWAMVNEEVARFFSVPEGGDLWSEVPRSSLAGAAAWLMRTRDRYVGSVTKPIPEWIVGRRVKNGLISGFGLTAFIGSIVSYAIGVLMRTKCPSMELTSQGDDIRIRVGGLSSVLEAQVAEAIDYVSALGVPLNPKKNVVLYRGRYAAEPNVGQADEYLRYVASGTGDSAVSRLLVPGTWGYLARSVKSILWRRPGGAEVEDPNSIMASWATYVSRGGDFDTARTWMVADLAGRTGVSEEAIVRVLQTPRAYGGFGHMWWSIADPSAWLAMRNVKADEPLAGERKQPEMLLTRTPWENEARARHIWTPDSVRRAALGFMRKGASDWKLSEVRRRPAKVTALTLGARPIRPKRERWVDPVLFANSAEELAKDGPRLSTMVENKSEVESLRTRMSRGLFVDWLAGKLKTPTPAGVLWSDSVASTVASEYEDAAIARLQILHKPNKLAWQGLVYSVELELRTILRMATNERFEYMRVFAGK